MTRKFVPGLKAENKNLENDTSQEFSFSSARSKFESSDEQDEESKFTKSADQVKDSNLENQDGFEQLAMISYPDSRTQLPYLLP